MDTTSIDATVTSRTAQSSALRKYTLLLLFCVAQFLDAFNISALFSAIPVMSTELDLNASEAVWLVSAYQLTFASFLLVSGRISDVYNPKYTFITGAAALGIFCLAAGFAKDKIALLVLRALAGVAAALTIPSSLTLIVRLFPEEREQARAIGIYGGCAALGNVLGLIIGAIFVEFANWSWVFWLGALVALPIASACVLLIPKQSRVDDGPRRIADLDPFGIALLTSALILLIFALTEAGTRGWGNAMVLAPLIIGVLLIAAFFSWEARIDRTKAAFPPHMWFYPNFAILFALALSIFLWFTATFLFKITLWQDSYGWSPINAAVHFLPIGLIAGPIMLFSAPLTARFQPKYVLLFAQMLLIISTVILPFADSKAKYWSRDFPSLAIGAVGGSLLFVNANVAIFHNTPANVAGTVGAIFNSALQLGSAVGIALLSSVDSAVAGKHPDKPYAGRAAAFWFLLAIVGTEMLAVALLYRVTPAQPLKDEEEGVDEKARPSAEEDGAEKKKDESAAPKEDDSAEKKRREGDETGLSSPVPAVTPLPAVTPTRPRTPVEELERD